MTKCMDLTELVKVAKGRDKEFKKIVQERPQFARAIVDSMSDVQSLFARVGVVAIYQMATGINPGVRSNLGWEPIFWEVGGECLRSRL